MDVQQLLQGASPQIKIKGLHDSFCESSVLSDPICDKDIVDSDLANGFKMIKNVFKISLSRISLQIFSRSTSSRSGDNFKIIGL